MNPVSAEPQPVPAVSRHLHAIILIGLAVLSISVYQNTVDGAFIFDDRHEVVENPSIRDLSDLGAAFRHQRARPLTNLSYALDYVRSGLDPRAYHITNIVLHALNVCLLYCVAGTVVADWSRRHNRSVAPQVVSVTAAALLAVTPS
jgi:protein O-mannosyl-transferase